MKLSSHKVMSLSLYLINTLSQLALLLLSGWFIAASALAGHAGVLAGFNYVIPATLIRFLAITRIASGYFEKYSAHLLLLRKLQGLRFRLLSQVFSRTRTLRQNETAKTLQQSSEQIASAWSSVTSPVATAATLVLMFTAAIWIGFSHALPLWLLFVFTFIVVAWVLHHLHQKALLQENTLQQQYLSRQRQWLQQSTLWHLGESPFSAQEVERMANKTALARSRVDRVEQMAETIFATLSLLFASGVFWFMNDLTSPSSWIILALIFMATREWCAPVVQALFASNRLELIEDKNKGGSTIHQATKSPSKTRQLIFHDFRWQRDRISGPALTAELNGPGLFWLKAPSGTGKSSFFDALVGELPHDGSFYIDGRDITQNQSNSVTVRFHYAEQQGHIFSDTLAANLRLANPSAGDQDLFEALRWAELNQWQQTSDLAIWLGEQGLPISGGEIKRLQLARAWLSQSSVWLLDEPFEGLDTETLKQLCVKINSERQQKVIILASHLLPDKLEVDGVISFSPESTLPPVSKSTQIRRRAHHQS